MFVLNYSAEQAEITLKTDMRNLFTGEREMGQIVVEKYGVRIYAV